jgi:hypothetical protein
MTHFILRLTFQVQVLNEIVINVLRENILVKVKVVMTFARLDKGNSLQLCWKMYGIVKGTTLIFFIKFCATIRKTFKTIDNT